MWATPSLLWWNTWHEQLKGQNDLFCFRISGEKMHSESSRATGLGLRQTCHGGGNAEKEVARKQRGDPEQAIAFKNVPWVTYFLRVGSVSITFYNSLIVSSNINSIYGSIHSLKQTLHSSATSQWLNSSIRNQVFNTVSVEDASYETHSRTFASPKLFFDIPTLGNTG